MLIVYDKHNCKAQSNLAILLLAKKSMYPDVVCKLTDK